MGIFGFKEDSATNADGSFRQTIRWDARDGLMTRVDRVQGVNGWENRMADITATAMFVADIPNIKPGWMQIGAQGPVKILGRLGAPPDKPEDPEFKRAFELLLLLHKTCANPDAEKEEVREWCANAKCVVGMMDGLATDIMNHAEAKAGKLPILRLDPDVPKTPVRTGSGAKASLNYAPRFVVMGWVDRPPAMAAPAAVEPVQEAFPGVNGGRQPNAPPTTGGQRVTAPLQTKLSVSDGSFGVATPPPPRAEPKPAPVTISADDFG